MQKGFNKSRKLLLITLCIIILWITTLTTDYWRTMHSLEKPLFALMLNDTSADDGGSGTYAGIGYSIEIKGNFMPEDEFSGVTHAKFMMFGKELDHAIRD